MFNVTKGKIENTIVDNEFNLVWSFIMLRDTNTLLCGCGNGRFCLYNMKSKKYEIIINKLKGGICSLIDIDNNTFISSSSNKAITC